MSGFGTASAAAGGTGGGLKMRLEALVGSGDRIGKLVLPVLVVGLTLNILYPDVFAVGGASSVLRPLSIAMLVPGVVGWLWSVVLILTRVPRGELITAGPFAIVKHPLYTSVALLVLPWAGFLLGTWLGVVLGVTLYVASRLFAPAEERMLAKTFGREWDEYLGRVRIPWL